MNYLVGDIGNTLTKICIVNKNFKISKEYSIETKKLLTGNNIYKFIFPILKKKITIKKPNDLLIENKKLCGILQEVIEFKNDKFLITGFGINTSICPLNQEFISTCLQEHTKIIINNLNIVKKIKNTYEKIINEFENNNFTSVKNEYI